MQGNKGNSMKIIVMFCLSVVFSTIDLIAQGCSDAGICSVAGAHYPNETKEDSIHDERYHLRAGITMSGASGEQRVFAGQINPELEWRITPSFSLQARASYIYTSGNLTTVSGAGDFITGIHYFKQRGNGDGLIFSLATKIPSGNADLAENGRPLPMPYQMSLGTLDLIGGVTYSTKSWRFSAGYQHILKNNNENGFLRKRWEGNEDAQEYFESKGLIRGNDVSLKVERVFVLKKAKLSTGLMSIYRISKDEFINDENLRTAIKNSDGLTINIALAMNYPISKRSGLMTVLGVPVFVREIRPDGTTRSAVLNIMYVYSLFKNSK